LIRFRKLFDKKCPARAARFKKVTLERKAGRI
jgi:hypothetical protein